MSTTEDVLEFLLNEIIRLQDLNEHFYVQSMVKGDKCSMDYTHGFEDGLSNMRIIIYSKYKALKGDKRCQ